jgi:hypothetical protein
LKILKGDFAVMEQYHEEGNYHNADVLQKTDIPRDIEQDRDDAD